MTPKFEDAISIIVKALEGRKDAPDYPDYDDINTAIGSLEKAVKILGILKPRMNFGEDDEEGEKVIWFFTIYEGEHGYDALKEWLEEKE